MTNSLTEKFIKSVQPHATQPKRYFDGDGLYLEVSKGGGKYFRLKYRFDLREKRLALGVWPDLSLKDARHLRSEIRSLIARDIDPAAQRAAKKAARTASSANSFEIVARE